MREIYRFACPTENGHCAVLRREDRFMCRSCKTWYDKLYDKKEGEMVDTKMYQERITST